MNISNNLYGLSLKDKSLTPPNINTYNLNFGSVDLVWKPTKNAISYDIYLSENLLSYSYVTTVSSTIYSLTGLNQNTKYYSKIVANVLSKDSYTQFQTMGFELPSLVKSTLLGGSLEFGSPILNDGNTWFWPSLNSSAQPGTFSSEILNQEPYQITSLEYLLCGQLDPPAQCLQIAVRDSNGVWSENRNIPEIISGGSFDSPNFIWAPELILNTPCNNNSRFWAQNVVGPGWVPAGSNFGTQTDPTMVSNEYFSAGDNGSLLVNDWDIGVLIPQIKANYSNGQPLLNVGIFGDSVVAQDRPSGSVNDRSREGYAYHANVEARSLGKNIRYCSLGQGSANYTQFKLRLYSVLPLIKDMIGLILFQLTTDNDQFSGVESANARWEDYLINVKAVIEATGLRCRAFMPNPSGGGVFPGNHDGYVRIAELIELEGGVNTSDVVVDVNGVDIKQIYSSDNAHINETGSIVLGPIFHNRVYNIAKSIGWDI